MILKKMTQNLKRKEKISHKLINERHDEILVLSKKVNFDYLRYYFKGKNICEKRFNGFDNACSFLKRQGMVI